MFNGHEKLLENDLDVVTKDNVFIGSNVLILKVLTVRQANITGCGDRKRISVHSLCGCASNKNIATVR